MCARNTKTGMRRSQDESVKVLVTGVIGSDTHIVGNRILSMALEKAGYKVITLGALTPAAEFIKAAVETNADAIMVSSLYGQGPSTVTSDIMVGMRAALADLEKRLGKLPRFKYRLASSSAAGGLRMVTVGLVRELTAEAARRAALGAGARLVGTFANRLTRTDVEQIVALAPDILLLAGGTDGGNSEVILYNAAALGSSALVC